MAVVEGEISPSDKKLQPIKFQSETLLSMTKRKFVTGVKNITIEPIILLVSLVTSIDSVALSQLIVDKSCAQDFNFTQEVCDNILNENYEHELSMVENEVAQYKVYENLIEHLFPIIMSFFLGSWSDIFGRKIVLYFFFAFRILEGSLLLVNVYFMEWPKEYMLLTVKLPLALSGGQLSYYMGINSFIADISAPEQRSFRMAILNLMGHLGQPFGTQIGKQLFGAGSYKCVIGSSLLGKVICLLLLVIRMETFKYKPKQKDIQENPVEKKQLHPLSPMHIIESFKTALKKRPNNKRFYLWVNLFVMNAVVIPMWGEGVIGYNYVMTRFHWGFDKYSDYTTVCQIIDIVGQFLMVSYLGYIKVRDALLVPILLACVITRDLIKAFSQREWMYYLGSVVYVACGYIFPCSRSILSVCVDPEELGKVFALLAAVEALIPLGMTQVYASVWAATSELGAPWVGSVFMMSAALTGFGFVMSLIALLRLKGKDVNDLDGVPTSSPVYKRTLHEFDTNFIYSPPKV